MFGIFNKVFETATRQDRWDAPQHLLDDRGRPRLSSAQRDRDRAEIRRQLRGTGMW